LGVKVHKVFVFSTFLLFQSFKPSKHFETLDKYMIILYYMNHLITSINFKFMPKCDICQKGSQKAANRSHSKVKTLRRQKPNLQKLDDHKVCTKCRRTITKKLSEMTA